MYIKENQREANKRWIEKNSQKWIEIDKNTSKIYYERHKEERNEINKKRYYFNKEVERMRNILL